jgi:hypothetical protein
MWESAKKVAGWVAKSARSALRAVVLIASVALLLPVSACDKPAKPVMLIYGDSLTVQSASAVSWLYGSKYTIVVRAWGGTAICDWVAEATSDRKTVHPDRVVIAFTGNTASCVKKDFLANGPAGATANYELALREMAGVFKGIPLSVVGSPAMNHGGAGYPTAFPYNGSPFLNAMYRRVCAQLGLTYNGGADDALTPGHVFTWMRPKLFGGSVVVVRMSDGVHLTSDGQLLYGSALGN